MARVLVTGGSGFIGRHLVEHLVRRGDRVRCLLRRNAPSLPAVECVRGDLQLPATLDRAVRDVDVVYHAAGATMVTSTAQYKAANSLGTRNLGEACARRLTPPVLLFLSSLAAAGPSRPEQPRREDDAAAPVSVYGRSKLRAEHHLRHLSGRVPITVLRPPGVFGPGDVNTFQLFKVAGQGFNVVAGAADQPLALLYVDDLVLAMPQAAEKGERLAIDRDPGRGIYFVAQDEWHSLVELGNLAAAVQGRGPVWTVHVVPWLVRLLARANDFLGRLTLRPKLLNSDKVAEALAGAWTCSSDKARRHWGFTCQTGLRDGFEKTVAWYRAQGWL